MRCFDRFRHRMIVFADEQSFGVKFTHHLERESSLSLTWDGIVAIDAMKFQPEQYGLIFRLANNAQKFLASNMENWIVLETAIRARFPDFDWNNFERAKNNNNNFSLRFRCWKRPDVKPKGPGRDRPMVSNVRAKIREVIFVDESAFGVNYAHLLQRKHSWTLRWEDVLAIDAIMREPAEMGLIFTNPENKWRLVAEGMGNWDALEQAIRKQFKDFNWDNFDLAANYIETQVPCWQRTT